jgi:hypothetical protein
MIRQIAAKSASKVNPSMAYQTAEEIDSETGSMLLQGYRLVSTHYLGAQKDVSTGLEYFGVMYIFQLEQSEVERMKNDHLKKMEKVE